MTHFQPNNVTVQFQGGREEGPICQHNWACGLWWWWGNYLQACRIGELGTYPEAVAVVAP